MWKIDERFDGWVLWTNKDAEGRPVWTTTTNAEDGTAVEPRSPSWYMDRETAIQTAEEDCGA